MIHDGRSRKLPFDPTQALRHLRSADPKLAALIMLLFCRFKLLLLFLLLLLLTLRLLLLLLLCRLGLLLLFLLLLWMTLGLLLFLLLRRLGLLLRLFLFLLLLAFGTLFLLGRLRLLLLLLGLACCCFSGFACCSCFDGLASSCCAFVGATAPRRRSRTPALIKLNTFINVTSLNRHFICSSLVTSGRLFRFNLRVPSKSF